MAEVLITLGIIGVVAALTMPTLMAQHRKHVVETRLAKFYSTMNQAIKMAEADYGDITTWERYAIVYEKDEDGNDTSKLIPNTEYFNKYIKPYISVINTEIVGNDKDGAIRVDFPDGSIATFSPSSIIFYPNGKDYKRVEDEDSGISKRIIDDCGKKWFTFYLDPQGNVYHYGKGVEPYKHNWDGTEEILRNDDALGCKESVSNERAYCTALIQMNGWKIPKDYPLKF